MADCFLCLHTLYTRLELLAQMLHLKDLVPQVKSARTGFKHCFVAETQPHARIGFRHCFAAGTQPHGKQEPVCFVRW